MKGDERLEKLVMNIRDDSLRILKLNPPLGAALIAFMMGLETDEIDGTYFPSIASALMGIGASLHEVMLILRPHTREILRKMDEAARCLPGEEEIIH